MQHVERLFGLENREEGHDLYNRLCDMYAPKLGQFTYSEIPVPQPDPFRPYVFVESVTTFDKSTYQWNPYWEGPTADLITNWQSTHAKADPLLDRPILDDMFHRISYKGRNEPWTNDDGDDDGCGRDSSRADWYFPKSRIHGITSLPLLGSKTVYINLITLMPNRRQLKITDGPEFRSAAFGSQVALSSSTRNRCKLVLPHIRRYDFPFLKSMWSLDTFGMLEPELTRTRTMVQPLQLEAPYWPYRDVNRPRSVGRVVKYKERGCSIHATYVYTRQADVSFEMCPMCFGLMNLDNTPPHDCSKWAWIRDPIKGIEYDDAEMTRQSGILYGFMDDNGIQGIY